MRTSKWKLPCIWCVCLICANFCMGFAASAHELRVLHHFCSEQACADGAFPKDNLVRDSSGNLYGIAHMGGAYNHGAVFQARKTEGGWKYKVIYDFCSVELCADGADPDGGLIIDADGALYGTATAGGKDAPDGVAFKLTPDAYGKNWNLRVLYDFCSQLNCVDGAAPAAALAYQGKDSGAPYDGVSPLYGVALGGGANIRGVAFELKPRPNDQWRFKVLWNFCSKGGSFCLDGRSPQMPLLVDPKGNLFGVTPSGGFENVGVVFELRQKNDVWTETTIYSFCPSAGCVDGAVPSSALLRDSEGNLYGTTTAGGNPIQGGVLYKLSPRKSGWKQKNLHTFCSEPNCLDGNSPGWGLTGTDSGALLGMTISGGENDSDLGGDGTIYKIKKDAFKVIYNFCNRKDCADGGLPEASVITEASGDLFGTAYTGGSNDRGTLFELKK